MARLSSLPPELLRIIVEHLDSTTDLHHAILGSKNVAQVFWTSTAFHLSKVLQNSISSLAQPFALAILDVDALPRTALKSEEDATESFLVQFFNNPRISFPTDMESLIVMSQRQNRIARFLTHYSALALFKCGAVLESIKPLPWWNPSSSDCANDQTQEILATNNLSPMERARFERGFYIHELLCHLFPCLSSYEQSEKHHSLFSGKQQHDLFISGIPPFQLEEVRCVHQYYMEIAGKMFDELEDGFVREILTFPSTQQGANLSFGGMSDWQLQQKHGYMNLDLEMMDFYGMDFYAHWNYGYRNASYAASLGLDYMYECMCSNTARRTTLIRFSIESERDFLLEALDHERSDRPISPDFSKNDDDSSCSRGGWWSNRYDGEDYYVYSGVNVFCCYRDLALIFWDLSRMEIAEESAVSFRGDDRAGNDLEREWLRSGMPADYRFEAMVVLLDDLIPLVKRYKRASLDAGRISGETFVHKQP